MRITHFPRLPLALLVAAVLTAGTACGGSDSDKAAGNAVVTTVVTTVVVDGSSTVAVDGSSTDGSSTDSSSTDGGIVEQIGGEGAADAIDNLSIGTKAFALATALGSDREAELVNDTTARIFLEGDVNTDSVMACIVVGAIIEANETVIVAYPNGEITCE